MSDLAEMWAALEAHQSIADKRGYGLLWREMCAKRTVKSADAAHAAASDAANAEWDAPWGAGWGAEWEATYAAARAALVAEWATGAVRFAAWVERVAEGDSADAVENSFALADKYAQQAVELIQMANTEKLND